MQGSKDQAKQAERNLLLYVTKSRARSLLRSRAISAGRISSLCSYLHPPMPGFSCFVADVAFGKNPASSVPAAVGGEHIAYPSSRALPSEGSGSGLVTVNCA